jgi:hypothetical protein
LTLQIEVEKCKNNSMGKKQKKKKLKNIIGHLFDFSIFVVVLVVGEKKKKKHHCTIGRAITTKNRVFSNVSTVHQFLPRQ